MDYFLHLLIITAIYVILTLSLNLIVGYTGLPAFGHAAFFAVGAYTSSLLALRFGVSPWLGLLVGACLCALLGVVVGLPSLRLKGDYLALATFGSAIIVYSVALNWVTLTRGPMGLPGIPGFSIFGFQLSAKWAYLVLMMLFVLFTYSVIRRLVGSPFGRVLRGIREDEIAALAMGKDVNRYKILAFTLGAVFAGLAGSLYAHYITFIDPSTFDVMQSINILLMVVFGGMGSLGGSVVGASVLAIFPELLRFLGMPEAVAAPLRQMVYGLLLVTLMLKRPQGILGKYRWE